MHATKYTNNGMHPNLETIADIPINEKRIHVAPQKIV